jgi:hypothetical protein
MRGKEFIFNKIGWDNLAGNIIMPAWTGYCYDSLHQDSSISMTPPQIYANFTKSIQRRSPESIPDPFSVHTTVQSRKLVAESMM